MLFGESLPQREIMQLESVLAGGVDLVVSVGTTSVFPYISGPVWWAIETGIPTVEINPGETELSHAVRYRLKLGAVSAFTEIQARLQSTKS